MVRRWPQDVVNDTKSALQELARRHPKASGVLVLFTGTAILALSSPPAAAAAARLIAG